MYELGTVHQFEAAHRLEGDFGPATRMHGHTYRLEVIVRGERLGDDGALASLEAVERPVQALISRLHMRDLAEVAELRDLNTTAETVARFCWDSLAPHMRTLNLSSLSIRLWESPRIFAGYDAPLR